MMVTTCLVRSPSLCRLPSKRSRQMQKTIDNLKVTVLCGLLTFVVLRSTLGAGKFGTPAQDLKELRESLSGLRKSRRALIEVRTTTKDTSRTLSAAAGTDEVFSTHFSGSKDDRPSILMVVGWEPTPCDNAAAGEAYLLKSMKNRIDYCNLHGIEILNARGGAAEGWRAKLEVIREAMVEHPGTEWVWWMGKGAIVTDMEFELPMERYDGYDMVVRGGRQGQGEEEDESFLVRNGETALAMLQAWAAYGVATERVFVESSYELQGRWKEALAGGRPFFVTEFAGGAANSGGCLRQLGRALELADRQIVGMHGFLRHT